MCEMQDAREKEEEGMKCLGSFGPGATHWEVCAAWLDQCPAQ